MAYLDCFDGILYHEVEADNVVLVRGAWLGTSISVTSVFSGFTLASALLSILKKNIIE
jgi:hypothetical protein